MNIIKAMAEQERDMVKKLRLEDESRWKEEWISRELARPGIKWEVLTEALLDHEGSIMDSVQNKDAPYIGVLVYILIRDYLRKISEKAWLEELEDINFPHD